MAKYSVIITDPTRDHGIGPVEIEAATADAAVEQFLADEQRTLEQLAEVGLTAVVVRLV